MNASIREFWSASDLARLDLLRIEADGAGLLLQVSDSGLPIVPVYRFSFATIKGELMFASFDFAAAEEWCAQFLRWCAS